MAIIEYTYIHTYVMRGKFGQRKVGKAVASKGGGKNGASKRSDLRPLKTGGIQNRTQPASLARLADAATATALSHNVTRQTHRHHISPIASLLQLLPDASTLALSSTLRPWFSPTHG
jgi:hypothetical protein